MSGPPPGWPGGGRRADDDLRDSIADLSGDVREFRAETAGRLDQLAQQLGAQVERLEERIADERHSRRSTDTSLSMLQERVAKLDDELDAARLSLARIAPPAAGAGLLGAMLYELLPKLTG